MKVLLEQAWNGCWTERELCGSSVIRMEKTTQRSWINEVVKVMRWDLDRSDRSVCFVDQVYIYIQYIYIYVRMASFGLWGRFSINCVKFKQTPQKSKNIVLQLFWKSRIIEKTRFYGPFRKNIELWKNQWKLTKQSFRDFCKIAQKLKNTTLWELCLVIFWSLFHATLLAAHCYTRFQQVKTTHDTSE